MESSIYIAFFALFVICGFLLYQHVQLERRLKEQDIAHKKALAEAGNAITDTLKVAFDNLKRNASDHSKINGKLTEQNSRIHRLEQHIGRTVRETSNKDISVPDEQEQRPKKVKSKYENEQ
jgi:hypothetical protein